MTIPATKPEGEFPRAMVFEDPSRHRWYLFMALAWTAVAAIGLIAGLIIYAGLGDAKLAPLPMSTCQAPTPDPADGEPIADAAGDSPSRERRIPAYPEPLGADHPLVTAFAVQSDPAARRQLAAIGDSLEIIFADGLSFDTGDGRVEINSDREGSLALRRTGAGIMTRITNTDAKGVWQPEAVSKLLRSEPAQRRFLDAVVAALEQTHAIGLNVDIESLERADSSLYLDFLQLVADALHRHHLYLTVDVPMNEDQYDYEAIGVIADAVVVMAYDEHFSTGTPGSIAGLEWFNDGIREYVHRIPPEKVIVALGAYGYDWVTGHPAEALSFEEAANLARRHASSVRTSDITVNSTFTYKDTQARDHQVWLLDGVSAWNQLSLLSDPAALEIKGHHLGGISVWRLGLEDPSIWKLLLAEPFGSAPVNCLKTIDAPAMTCTTGEGHFYRVYQERADGARSLSMNGRTIAYTEYTELPEPFAVHRAGDPDGPRVALTFDDGPDPLYTVPLLDLLKRHGVRATFFVLGSQAVRYPELLRRMVREGHLIGNHTFDHPRLDAINYSRLHRELNAAERAIESACGKQTLLFRSPYDIDTSPSRQAQLEPLAAVAEMGYLCVGANVGADDYAPGATPESIAEQVLSRLSNTKTSVVCLHDAGGNRAATVAAVDRIITDAQARGLEFVGLETLLNVNAETLNPKIPPAEAPAAAGAGLSGWLHLRGMTIVSTIFVGSTIVAIIRITSLGLVMILDRRRRKARDAAEPYREPVTILVPAYNEAKVIRRTVEGILRSADVDVRILVIDDGSKDDTAAIVEEMALTEPRVSVVTQANAGKASALNRGFRLADTEVVVVLDADTIVRSHTIASLVAPFTDRAIDAVCGNVQVGNVCNLLTALQDIEYVTCQNYDRRAFDALNCIGVVPGATGAWRRKTVLDAGGYSHDTLTEDADLTLEVLRRGGRIVYAPEARSVTEAPETVRELYRQRFRWGFGTFQTLWKHRSAFGRGTVGWVAMPNLLIFQGIFPMLAPIGDAVLLYSIVTGQWNAVASGYFTFIVMDLIGSGIALAFEGRSLLGIWTVFVQRFCYRQFMYVVTFSAALAAIRGRRHGWNKLDRTASVQLPEDLAVEVGAAS